MRTLILLILLTLPITARAENSCDEFFMQRSQEQGQAYKLIENTAKPQLLKLLAEHRRDFIEIISENLTICKVDSQKYFDILANHPEKMREYINKMILEYGKKPKNSI